MWVPTPPNVGTHRSPTWLVRRRPRGGCSPRVWPVSPCRGLHHAVTRLSRCPIGLRVGLQPVIRRRNGPPAGRSRHLSPSDSRWSSAAYVSRSRSRAVRLLGATATARPAADTGSRESRSPAASASRPSSPRASAQTWAACSSVWSSPRARRASWSPWSNAPTPMPSAEQSAMASAMVTRREPFSRAAMVGRLSPVSVARSIWRMPFRARRARRLAAITWSMSWATP